MISDDTDYSFGRTPVDCVRLADPLPAIAEPLATEYAGAREHAPFPGRTLVRPIALLLCLIFVLQSRAGAAATPNTGMVPAYWQTQDVANGADAEAALI